MKRHSRRSSKSDKSNLGLVLGTIGMFFIIGIISVYVFQNLSRRDTDRTTGCPKDRYDAVTVVLIDLTDSINPIQAAALRNTLFKIRNDVPRFGRLEIYPLEPTTARAIEPRFVGCSPGSGRDIDSGLYGNPELADRRWKEQFADKVDRVISELQNVSPQDSSPILEGIQSIAVTALGSPLGRAATDKRIIIISDMIHHTSDFSMYRGAPEFNEFKNTPYYRRVKASLREAKVDVSLIVRETRRDVQQPPLYKFWVDLTTASNGFLQHWEPLQ